MRIELSGFADEINPLMDVQLRVLNDLGIRFIELRGVDGNNITSLTLEETETLKKKLEANGVQVSAIGSPLGKISIHDEFEPHLALFDHVVKQAAILGTKYIRMFSFYDADEKERDEVLAELRSDEVLSPIAGVLREFNYMSHNALVQYTTYLDKNCRWGYELVRKIAKRIVRWQRKKKRL